MDSLNKGNDCDVEDVEIDDDEEDILSAISSTCENEEEQHDDSDDNSAQEEKQAIPYQKTLMKELLEQYEDLKKKSSQLPARKADRLTSRAIGSLSTYYYYDIIIINCLLLLLLLLLF
jgi:predicted RNA-binding protein with RPS1 domain